MVRHASECGVWNYTKFVVICSKRHNKLLFPALVKAIYASFYKPEKAISNVVNYKSTIWYSQDFIKYRGQEDRKWHYYMWIFSRMF